MRMELKRAIFDLAHCDSDQSRKLKKECTDKTLQWQSKMIGTTKGNWWPALIAHHVTLHNVKTHIRNLKIVADWLSFVPANEGPRQAMQRKDKREKCLLAAKELQF